MIFVLDQNRCKTIPKYNGRLLLSWRIVPFMEPQPRRRATARPLLSVVDDDESVRESLPDLLREFGFAANAFSSAEGFLSSDNIDETKCLILDVAMPGMTGLELQQELKRRGELIPIIFITAQKDEAIREQALNQGAVKVLYKPFSETVLLEALNAVFRRVDSPSAGKIMEGRYRPRAFARTLNWGEK